MLPGADRQGVFLEKIKWRECRAKGGEKGEKRKNKRAIY
jgi:hypothetical protein